MKIPLACDKTGRTFAGTLLAIVLAMTFLSAGGCTSKRDFSADPVKWSFVGGDGIWDDKSRRWSVSLSAGETKSATIRLSNTTPQPIWLAVVEAGPPDIGLHLEGPLVLPSSNLVDVPAAGNTEITIGATAYSNLAPKDPHRYVVDLGDSFNTLGRPAMPGIPSNFP